MAIQGDGFFQVQMPDGTLAYTRDGALEDVVQRTSDDQRRVARARRAFSPFPPARPAVTISPDGQVDDHRAPAARRIFRCTLVRFANPAGLQSVGRNLYLETLASGTPETGTPEPGGFGSLQQGYLEMSNVKVVEEMVNMIVAQRAYEVNSKAVQAADEMMQQSDNLRR